MEKSDIFQDLNWGVKRREESEQPTVERKRSAGGVVKGEGVCLKPPRKKR